MNVYTDFVLNGQAEGNFGFANHQLFGEPRFDPGMLRPYWDPITGQKCVTLNTGRFQMDTRTGKKIPVLKKVLVKELVQEGHNLPIFNSTSLTKEQWIQFDAVTLKAARYRLRAWDDLMKSNVYSGFNGMGKMILEHETLSDPGAAQVDMDGLSTSQTNDAPRYQLQGLPLPIIHSGFWFSQRLLTISRSSGSPLDMTQAEAASRRIAEKVENIVIGTTTGVTYGGQSTQYGGYGRTSQVYGYTNYPDRITYTTLTTPTGSNPEATVADVLACRDTLYNHKFYGPFMIYHSTDWDKYMDNDYARLGGNNANMTLRDRLRAIEGIQDVRRLDYLSSSTNPFTLIFVQMTPDVVRAVNGLDMTTIQWESQGGMRIDFKIMCIWVPQIRSDFYGNCGILHATTA